MEHHMDQQESFCALTGKDIDRLLQNVNPVNKVGRYQAVILVVVCFILAAPYYAYLSTISFSYTPPHHCRVDNLSQIPKQYDPLEDHWELSSCTQYATVNSTSNLTDNNRSMEIVPCQNGWTYDRSQYQESIITEYNLVCSKQAYLETMMTISNIITIPSTILVSFLCDKFGRKKVLVVSYFIERMNGLLQTLMPSTETIAIFMGAAALSSGEGIALLIAFELFPSKYRGIVGALCQLIYILLVCFGPLTSNYVRNWRTLGQVSTAVATVVGLICLWILPESLTWQLSNGRFTEAEIQLQKIAKFNNIKVESSILHEELLLESVPPPPSPMMKKSLPSDETSTTAHVRDGRLSTSSMISRPQSESGSSSNEYQKSNFLNLFKSKRMRKITFILCPLFLVNALVYSGMYFIGTYLGGNIHLNNFIMTVIEVPSYIVAVIVLPKLGRKRPAIVFHVIAGLGLLASVSEVTAFARRHSWIPMLMVLIAKFGVSGSFAVICIYGPELFPTNLRSMGSGLCRVSELVGHVLVPYTSIYLSKIAPWLSRAIFGTLIILLAIPILLLPETKDKPLPATIEEIEEW